MHYSETAYDQLHAKTMKILHLIVLQRAWLAKWLRSLTHDHHTRQKKFTGFQDANSRPGIQQAVLHISRPDEFGSHEITEKCQKVKININIPE